MFLGRNTHRRRNKSQGNLGRKEGRNNAKQTKQSNAKQSKGGDTVMRKQIVNMLVMASLVAGPASLITGCAVTRHQETAGEYANDSKITAKVKTDLYKDKLVKGTEVNVKTMNGVVQLSGFVESEQAKERAGQIARQISGVVDVHNDLITPTGHQSHIRQS